MSKRNWIVIVAAAALCAAVFSAGCVRVKLPESQKPLGGEPGKSSSESTSAPLGGANQIDATIRMGIGDLTVSDVPSTTAAFTGKFTYNPVSWKPETSYQVNPIDGGAIGAVYVGQPESDSVMKWGETENTWKLALASGVPTNLSMKLGAGEADVDPSGVDVRFLEAVTGVGSTTIDLSGPRTTDVDANITAGVGELTLRLPSDIGVQITGGAEGLGNVSSDGFTSSGNVLTNAAWGTTGPKMTIRIVRGVGDVRFELVD